MIITRSQTRRAILMVVNQKVDSLDAKEKAIAEAVRESFHPYVGGRFGWLDFTYTWDIHPDLALPPGRRLEEETRHVPVEGGLVKLAPEDWPEWIITALEFKMWRARWEDLEKGKLPPPCMTRQEPINGG